MGIAQKETILIFITNRLNEVVVMYSKGRTFPPIPFLEPFYVLIPLNVLKEHSSFFFFFFRLIEIALRCTVVATIWPTDGCTQYPRPPLWSSAGSHESHSEFVRVLDAYSACNGHVIQIYIYFPRNTRPICI